MVRKPRISMLVALALGIGGAPCPAQLMGQGNRSVEALPFEDGSERLPPQGVAPNRPAFVEPDVSSGASRDTEPEGPPDFGNIARGPEVPLETQEERIYAESMWRRFSMGRGEPPNWYSSAPLEERDLSDPEGIRNLFREYARLASEEDRNLGPSIKIAGYLNQTRKQMGPPRRGGRREGAPDPNARYDGFMDLASHQQWFYGQSFLSNTTAPMGRLVHAMRHENPSFYARRLGWQLEDWQESGELSRSDELAIYMLRSYPEDFHIPFAREHGAFDGVDVPKLP